MSNPYSGKSLSELYQLEKELDEQIDAAMHTEAGPSELLFQRAQDVQAALDVIQRNGVGWHG